MIDAGQHQLVIFARLMGHSLRVEGQRAFRLSALPPQIGQSNATSRFVGKGAPVQGCRQMFGGTISIAGAQTNITQGQLDTWHGGHCRLGAR